MALNILLFAGNNFVGDARGNRVRGHHHCALITDCNSDVSPPLCLHLNRLPSNKAPLIQTWPNLTSPLSSSLPFHFSLASRSQNYVPCRGRCPMSLMAEAMMPPRIGLHCLLATALEKL